MPDDPSPFHRAGDIRGKLTSGGDAQLPLSNGAATDLRTWTVGDIGSVLSFGEDSAGEVYVLSNGTAYRISSGS